MKTIIKLLWVFLLSSVIAPSVASAQTAILLTTITNPAPAYKDYFGYSVTRVGSDRVLIGAYGDDTGNANAGAAYLFLTNGALLATFTNPAPAYDDQFGWAVAAVGTDRVVIGAWKDDAGSGGSDAGAAFLFSTNGALLTTITNPAPAHYDYFGWSVAAAGSDLLLIGAYGDDAGAMDTGAAYLYSTNGILVTTFTNPAPANNDWFGRSVAAVGSESVLVGAPYDGAAVPSAGAAYLFQTNGLLLTVFTNPTAATSDMFGDAVAAVGGDRVLIGACRVDTSATDSGAAYLFSTNGTLLTIFTNPTPALADYFGYAVAAVGSDRVLIGAHQEDTGSNNAGAVYLFNASGTLLATITNPTPAANDYFGYAVATLGSDRVLVGAHQDDSGAVDAGSVYLFSIPPPEKPLLSLENPCRVGTNFSFSFRSLSGQDYTVEYNDDLSTTNWEEYYTVIGDGSLMQCLILRTNTAQRFFRVRMP